MRALNRNQGVIALIALMLLMVQLMVQTLQGTVAPAAPVQTTVDQNVTIIEQGGKAESTFLFRPSRLFGGVAPCNNCHGRYPGVGAAVDPSRSGWD